MIQENLDPNINWVVLDIHDATLCAMPKEEDSDDSGRREYIAGPMTGYPQWNYSAFDRARDARLKFGIQVISPADLGRARGVTEDRSDTLLWDASLQHEACMIDTTAVLNCTGIFMLKGWENSVMGRVELLLADKLGLTITYDDDAEVGLVDTVAKLATDNMLDLS